MGDDQKPVPTRPDPGKTIIRTPDPKPQPTRPDVGRVTIKTGDKLPIKKF
jgi:hypothetical protein